MLLREAAFLQKPFTPDLLAEKVRQVLKEETSPPGTPQTGGGGRHG
jgi:hypothetical protein